MKKIVFGLIIFALLFSLIATQSPSPVSATGVGEGSWVLPDASSGTTYVTVDVEKAAQAAPTWVRLFSDGIKINAPTKICYSFRRGAYHWVPKIMQLKTANWINVTSTIEYLDGEEGGTFACAKPNDPGTYALFAYYNGPKEVAGSEPGQLFTVGNWDWPVDLKGKYDYIHANVVNWNGYPTATQLVLGLDKSIDFKTKGIKTSIQTTIDITGKPHPQNYDISTTHGGGLLNEDPDNCRTIPFVELRDAADTVLARIENLDFQYWCLD